MWSTNKVFHGRKGLSEVARHGKKTPTSNCGPHGWHCTILLSCQGGNLRKSPWRKCKTVNSQPKLPPAESKVSHNGQLHCCNTHSSPPVLLESITCHKMYVFVMFDQDFLKSLRSCWVSQSLGNWSSHAFDTSASHRLNLRELSVDLASAMIPLCGSCGFRPLLKVFQLWKFECTPHSISISSR